MLCRDLPRGAAAILGGGRGGAGVRIRRDHTSALILLQSRLAISVPGCISSQAVTVSALRSATSRSPCASPYRGGSCRNDAPSSMSSHRCPWSASTGTQSLRSSCPRPTINPLCTGAENVRRTAGRREALVLSPFLHNQLQRCLPSTRQHSRSGSADTIFQVSRGYHTTESTD